MAKTYENLLFVLGAVVLSGSFTNRVYPLDNQELDKKEERVVYGDLFIVPSSVARLSSAEYDTIKKDGYEIRAQNGDTFVQVWATSKGYSDTLIIHLNKQEPDDQKGSCNWAAHGHPHLQQFPRYLPVSLFIDKAGTLKKDGDGVVIYYIHPQTNERVKIVLTLNQRNYRYASCGTYRDGRLQDGGFDNCIKALSGYEKLVRPYLSE